MQILKLSSCLYSIRNIHLSFDFKHGISKFSNIVGSVLSSFDLYLPEWDKKLPSKLWSLAWGSLGNPYRTLGYTSEATSSPHVVRIAFDEKKWCRLSYNFVITVLFSLRNLVYRQSTFSVFLGGQLLQTWAINVRRDRGDSYKCKIVRGLMTNKPRARHQWPPHLPRPEWVKLYQIIIAIS